MFACLPTFHSIKYPKRKSNQIQKISHKLNVLENEKKKNIFHTIWEWNWKLNYKINILM